MKGKINSVYFCITFFIFFLLVSESIAYPRFAAYGGDKCMDCHVDPTGGTMRNSYGIEFAKKILNMDMFKKLVGKTQFSPKITKEISVGGDVRVAQVDDQVEGSSNFNSFLSMQGDLYVNAQVNKILNIFVTSGIDIPGIDTKYEVYGMISNLPANTYFKVGRYKPNYGLKIVEHRAYQRKFLLNAPYDVNTGFELGISPEWFSMNVGLYNPMNTEFLTLDPHKMVVANTDFNFNFNDNNFNVNFGGAFFNNPHNTSDTAFTTTITAVRQAYGGYTRIGVMKRVSLLGEIDFEEMKSDRPLTRRLYAYTELNVVVIKGLEIRGQYEYFDVNRDITGDHIQRISGGFAAFPFFGFETEMMVRFPIEDPEQRNDEFQWNLHFYF
ncbi:MAG: hypothetical protein M3R36_12305 [Bacteroidota bacterium]|nr:hypothetical protein [Bacteroidota bacterium]